ncbi:DUF6090 family protein [Gaetbulibacter aestuarii]|uniref:DUF6090 family protein n=1 Tax=Gaetbulibacter aestuarii TaxID=1502358 RepID=A0ABW7MYA0_9FLAO
MIKFFRNIRQKLLKENKTTGYFKYAIGEIVLVVIGILIALNINNWNENLKDQVKKEKLMNALEVEFRVNLIQLDTVLSYDNKVLKSTQDFLKITGSTDIDTLAMPGMFQNLSWKWTFDPLNGALRSGISSGDIHLIKNDLLVKLLFGWEDVVSDARENEDRCVAVVINSKPLLEKYIRNLDYRRVWKSELPPSQFDSDYIGLLNDPLFEDYLTERYITMADALSELNVLREANKRMLDMIRSELKTEMDD